MIRENEFSEFDEKHDFFDGTRIRDKALNFIEKFFPLLKDFSNRFSA
jgi:hypothetical protein